jgi:hypothetical protein
MPPVGTLTAAPPVHVRPTRHPEVAQSFHTLALVSIDRACCRNRLSLSAYEGAHIQVGCQAHDAGPCPGGFPATTYDGCFAHPGRSLHGPGCVPTGERVGASSGGRAPRSHHKMAGFEFRGLIKKARYPFFVSCPANRRYGCHCSLDLCEPLAGGMRKGTGGGRREALRSAWVLALDGGYNARRRPGAPSCAASPCASLPEA